MNAQELPIKDIHIPAAIDWWPPAVGWWLLAMMLPLAVVLLIWLYKVVTRKTAVKAAKKMLLAIQKDSEQTDYQKLCAISTLLRRTAISCYPRAQAAALTGRDWLLFLDAPMSDRPFSEGPGKILSDAPYQRCDNDQIALDDLILLCHDWLKKISRIKQ